MSSQEFADQTSDAQITTTPVQPEPAITVGADGDPHAERDDRYEETTKSAWGSNADATGAFNDFKIKPSRTRSRTKAGWNSFERPAYYAYGSSVHTYQWDNGAGLIERTNRQSRGMTRFRLPSGDTLSQISPQQLFDWLPDGIGLSDVHDQLGAEDDWGGLDSDENSVITCNTGDIGVILRDQSANRGGGQYAGMWVEPDDPHYAHVCQLIDREDFGALSDLVAPDEVLASDLPVIDSSTYRNRSGRANAGGFGHEESIGDVIIRQGEWYFIPTDEELSFPDAEIDKPLQGANLSSASILGSTSNDGPLGSHVPRDLVEVEEDMAQQRLTGDSMDVEPGIYVRGTVRHRRNEHSMFNLYDRWHKVVENTEDMTVFESSSGGVRYE